MPKLGTLTSFVAGQVAQASQVNQNFTDTKTAVNSAMFSDVVSVATALQTFSGGANVTGFKQHGPVYDVTHPDFGAKGDGVTDDTPAILAAINAAKLRGSTISGAPAPSYVGVTFYFPSGKYLVKPNQLAINDFINVRFVGDGSRNWNNYFDAPSCIIVDGTGTSSTDWGINVSGQVLNMTRNVMFENLSVMYTNSFAGDLVKGAAAGFSASQCWFGSSSTSSTRPMTCANLIRFWTGHHYRFSDCSFSDAAVLVRLDNNTGSATNGWHFEGCTFFDCSTAHLYCDGAPIWALNVVGCDFDTASSPTYGIYLNCQGFHIAGCGFYGTASTTAPTDSWIKIVEGTGDISGCLLVTTVAPAIHASGGSTTVRGCTFFSTKSILADNQGGIFGGGNDHYYFGSANTENALDFQQTVNGQIEYGPDRFFVNQSDNTKKYAYSVNVTSPAGGTGNWQNLAGVVKYNAIQDATLNGPLMGALVLLEQIRPTTFNYTANQTLTPSQSGCIITNDGATGAATFTLPQATAGYRYTFQKFTNQTLTVATHAGDFIYKVGSMVTSIADTTSGELFAEITLEGHYNPLVGSNVWRIVRMTGTWA